MAQGHYAYGDTCVHGKPCVAASVDENLLDRELLTVAELYDEAARERFGGDKGTVTPSTAEELWQEAIDRAHAQLNVERDPDHAKYLRRAIEQAEDVKGKAF